MFQYSKAIFSLPTRAAILALSQVIDLLIFFVDRSTTSDKIDSNEIALAPESTISPGADSETNYTDSVDLQITLPKKGSFNSVGIPPSVSVALSRIIILAHFQLPISVQGSFITENHS